MIQIETNHSLFYHKILKDLIVYVDDIVIIGSDKEDVVHLNQYFAQQFQTKDLNQCCTSLMILSFVMNE